MLSVFLPVTALAAGILASPTNIKRSFAATSVFESIDAPAARWVKESNFAGLSKDEQSIELRIQLAQQNMDKFHEVATNIATPGHSQYLQHISTDAINSIIAPKQESKDSVTDWLAQAGLGDKFSLSSRGNALVGTATVSEVEKLLGAVYDVYTDSETGLKVARTLEYSLPDDLKGHVSMVQPTTFFGLRSSVQISPAPEEIASTESVDAVTGCTGSTITPKCLSNLYNFASTTSSTVTAGKIGIAGFLEQHPSKSDLSTFLGKYAISGNTADTYTCTTLNGGTCPASPGANVGVEANLDVQYARAITLDIPNVFYSVGGSPPYNGTGTNDNEPYLEFLDYLLDLADADLPNTISISYGDDQSTVPLSYATEVCDLFSQIGARGVTITAASGDSSVGTAPCKLNGKTQFLTSFPASCPWITTVGGTTGVSPEATWIDGGAGFSEVFGRPSYQDTAVTAWLSSNTDGVSAYINSSGRAYPDVAVQAQDFYIVDDARTTLVSGTSCASPTFAGVIQLINSARVAAGKPGLGFLNPWIYANATSGFNDITSGKTTGCRGTITGGGSFSAVTGWDPATGWGSPNYAKLLALANSV